MCIAASALVDAQNLEHANLVQFSSVVHAQYPHMQIVLVAAAATKLAAWMQRRLELKTGIKLQLLFSLLPLLSYCLLLSMLFSLLLLSLSLLPLFAVAPEFLSFGSSRIPSVLKLPNSFRFGSSRIPSVCELPNSFRFGAPEFLSFWSSRIPSVW